MQVVWPLCLAWIGCAAPAKPALDSTPSVGELTRIVANDCPYTKLGPWQDEVFPACGRFPIANGFPICRGSTCAPACGMSGGSISGPMGRERSDFSELYSYDARGRFVALTYNGTAYVSCEYNGEHRSRCTMGVGEDARVRSVTRDEKGRIVSLDSGDDSLGLTYDGTGRLAAIGSETFTYNEKGWLVAMGATRYDHDAEGHVIEETKRDGVVTYLYEGDRLVGVRGPGPHKTVSFRYDDQGRLAAIARGGLEDEGIASTVYSYDCK